MSIDHKRFFTKIDPSHYQFFRGGVILYKPDVRKIGLAIDRDYGNLIDFGGHRENHELNIIDTALRECEEETLSLFTVDELKEMESYHLYDNITGPNDKDFNSYYEGDMESRLHRHGLYELFIVLKPETDLDLLRKQFSRRRINREKSSPNPKSDHTLENVDIVFIDIDQFKLSVLVDRPKIYPLLRRFLKRNYCELKMIIENNY